MNIPKRIKILGYSVPIAIKGDILIASDGDEAVGLTYKWTNRIEICRGFEECGGNYVELSEHAIADTFLHEIIHHIAHKLGIEVSEQDVTSLACGLLQVIRDNKLDFRG